MLYKDRAGGLKTNDLIMQEGPATSYGVHLPFLDLKIATIGQATRRQANLNALCGKLTQSQPLLGGELWRLAHSLICHSILREMKSLSATNSNVIFWPFSDIKSGKELEVQDNS